MSDIVQTFKMHIEHVRPDSLDEGRAVCIKHLGNAVENKRDNSLTAPEAPELMPPKKKARTVAAPGDT